MIITLKNGSGIHIKKSHEGLFTKYCNGKVTDECIRRGKNSSDPKIRRRATFAANARKWKHKEGGKAFVKGVNVLDSNPKAYKEVKKKYKMRSAAEGTKIDWAGLASNLASTVISTYSLNKQAKAQAEALKAANNLNNVNLLDIYSLKLKEQLQKEKQKADAIKAMTGETVNVSDIASKNRAYMEASREYSLRKNQIDLQNKVIDAQVQAQTSNNWGNAASNLIQMGAGALTNYLGNKKSATNDAPVSTGIASANILRTNYDYFNIPKSYGTFNSNGSMNLGNGLGTYSIIEGYKPTTFFESKYKFV